MDYRNALTGHLADIEAQARSNAKLAWDLAELLDHPALQLTFDRHGKHNYGSPTEQRQTAFDLLCAVLLESGVKALPPLEEGLWRGYLNPINPDNKDEAKAEAEGLAKTVDVLSRIGKRTAKDATTARSLALMFSLFPKLHGTAKFNRNVDLNELTALLNHYLVDKLGEEPLRPDYKQIAIPDRATGPGELTCVVIADDSAEEIFNTALALVGTPNIQIIPYLQRVELEDTGLTMVEHREGEIRRASKEILALKPNIVLMDELMIDMTGDQLVNHIRSLSGGGMIRFVGNTGGDGEKLKKAGCFGNFQKGRNKQCRLW